MTRSELQRWLLDEGVRAAIASVTRASIVADLEGIVPSPTAQAPVDPLDWDRLLLAGSILTQSAEREFAEAALRIATAALTLETAPRCQSALNFDPGSARNFDPVCVGLVAGQDRNCGA